jgi:F-type H+-transporting ATPase subunit epsilon
VGTSFQVELVTPERVLFSGEADAVSLRAVEGEITFLAGHEDYVGVADVTVVRIGVVGRAGDGGAGQSSTELRAAVHGGFVHVDGEGVVILAGVAELDHEIDVARARAALVAAEGRVGDGTPAAPEPGASERAAGASQSQVAPVDPDPASPQAAIRRARVRLEAAGATAPA